MSAIKKWFEDKKREKKFSRIGPGQRLCDSSTQRNAQAAAAAASSASTPRLAPSASAARAGAAALARLERAEAEKKAPRPIGGLRGSGLRTEAEVRQEIQLEQQDRQLAVDKFSEPVEINTDAAPVLAVKGVYFKCPLVSPESLSWEEWKPKIRQFLAEQMGQDSALCAAVAIRTLNPADRAEECAQTIAKYVNNVLANPGEEKYRRIRLGNAVFQQRVHPACESALDFLLACGFQRQAGDSGEDFLVLPPEADLEALAAALECLQTAEGIEPLLDRCTSLLEISPGSAASVANRVALPEDFYSLTPEELELERLRLRQAAESEEMLRTRQMRECERQRETRRYRFCLVRVRLPGGRLILQATFAATEQLADIYSWLRDECLEASAATAFRLVSPDKRRLDEADGRTLAELGLCPAAVLALAVSADDGAAAAGSASRLRPALAALVQPLV
ncbi:hypothetical protein BOX15_Mlig010682g1 [Macrostomum lignano]|uniref:UBX domain-containing protein n=1 Tax=Macrostomum lignano TaxID=282301 RepID=A0A267FWC4_9PLAT|nr:hypothetical protein BOX15_Mlig010682g1 [Macrostomum lignano]